MRATSAFKRLFIRGLAWDAEQSGGTFEDALRTAAKARLTETSRGKVLVGTATNGTSVNYSLPSVGDVSAQDMAEVCSAVLDAVDAIKAETPAIKDGDLLTALLAQFPSIRALRPDFSLDCR